MSQLSGFPLVNQNHEPTMDGHPDENAPNNCVVADLAAILMYYHPGRTYDGDEIKDAVYGQGYTGPMDPAHFVAYMESQGVLWKETQGEPLALVMAAHAYVAAGSPVLLQIPSNWNEEPPPTEGSTHAVVAVKEDSGSLTCMNPWGGFWHYGSDSYWQARIRYASVWRAEVQTVGVPQGWRDDGRTLVSPNGAQVVLGFRDYILAHPWAADDVPVGAQYHMGDQVAPSQTYGPGDRQDFTRTSLIYTQALSVAVAPVAADFATSQAMLAQARAQIAALQQQLGTTAEPGYVEYKALVAAIAAGLKAYGNGG